MNSTPAKFAMGISGTGEGDYFIRKAAAHEVTARVRLLGQTIHEASHAVIAELKPGGGEGAMLVLDSLGNCESPCQSDWEHR